MRLSGQYLTVREALVADLVQGLEEKVDWEAGFVITGWEGVVCVTERVS